jgi:DNA-binding GntR family transcriptional regulator
LHQRATRFRNLSNAVGWRERDVAGEHEALAKAAIERRVEDALRLLEAHYQRTGVILDRGIEAG